MNPIDLLPIKNPKDENPSDTFFYENVVKHLLPDFLRIEENGIPIDLNKVVELEEVVSTVLDKVHDKLKTNPIMLDFLKDTVSKAKASKIEQLQTKKKTYEDFLKPYNPKNKIHRTYVVNLYLGTISKANMKMDEWSKKDLKLLNQIIASKFISDLLEDKISQDNPIIIEAMKELAEDKCRVFNKNKIETKIEDTKQSDMIMLFNPGSSTQKRAFFDYYGIQSDNVTPAGNPKWDRDELIRVQKLVKMMLDEKEEKFD